MRKLAYRLKLLVLWPWVIPLVFIRAAWEFLGHGLGYAITAFAISWAEDWHEIGFKQAFKAFKKGERL